MRTVLGIVVAIVMSGAVRAQTPAAASCKPVGRPQFLAAVPEASGLASAGGALWTHNDSGAPVLFRIESGRPTAVTIAGAEVRDWEDVAAGACGSGTCLYIADIGDNKGSRQRITIYEVPIPPAGSTSAQATSAISAKYPDSPHDAEALLVTRKLGMFVITKEAPPRIYQLPSKAGETGTLKLLRTLPEKMRITGAAVSADERWIALRSNNTLLVYTLDEFSKGGMPVRIDLTSLKEPQGEGVAFGSGGDLFLISEGGGGEASGVLTRIHCAFVR
jgi:hypothetical protein